MIALDARKAVKGYLDIEDGITTFDDAIDGFVLSGVKRLYPVAQLEVEAQTVSITSQSGRASVNLSTLSTPLMGVRNAETGDSLEPVDTYAHASTLYLQDVPSSTKTAILYGLARFSLGTVYEELELAVVYFATAEFYKYLLGNKRKYNAYVSTGRNTVENVQELIDYFEGLANQHLADRVTLYGAS